MPSALQTGSPVRYAFRFRDKMCLWQPPRTILQRLATLSALRQRLLRVRQQPPGGPVQQPIDEQQGFAEKSLQKQLAKNCQASLKAITADLVSVEKQINTLIQSDDRLKELFAWITARRPGSVPGVGDAIATEMLVATNERPAAAVQGHQRSQKTGGIGRPTVTLVWHPLNTDRVAVYGPGRRAVKRG